MKISEAVGQYLLQLEADGRSQHTIRQARRHTALLVRFLGDREIAEVGHQDLARFLVSAMATKTSEGTLKTPVSMNALRSTVRTFFSFAHSAGIVTANPARLVRRARVGPRAPRGLSGDEQARLRRSFDEAATWADRRDVALFTLLLDSGIRIGSALGLEVGDLDLASGEAHLRTLKGGGCQVTFLTARAIEMLRTLLAGRTWGPVFTGKDGDRIGSRQVHRRLGQWCRRAGLGREVGAHALRHTFAMGVYARTGDVLIVQAALGHRSIMSSCVYARALAADVRRALLNLPAPVQKGGDSTIQVVEPTEGKFVSVRRVER
jgi:site-specific recombinase XerC